jgi:hypothetical protein
MEWAYQNHCIGDLLGEQRIPLNDPLALDLILAIFLVVLLNLVAAQANVLVCVQMLEEFIDGEQEWLFCVVLGTEVGALLAHDRYLAQ